MFGYKSGFFLQRPSEIYRNITQLLLCRWLAVRLLSVTTNRPDGLDGLTQKENKGLFKLQLYLSQLSYKHGEIVTFTLF